MAIIVNDTFTGTSGTLLSAHTTDNGKSWINPGAATDTIKLDGSGRAYATGSATQFYYANVVPASADYSVEADFVFLSATSGYPGICLRCSSDGSNRYYAIYNPAGSIQFYPFTAGVQGAALASFSFTATAGATNHLKLTAVGSTFTVTLDGTTVITTTSTAITAAGFPGIQEYGADTLAGGLHFDNYQATDSSSSAATDFAVSPAAQSGLSATASSPYTVTPNGTPSASVTVTLSDASAGGTFTPATLTFTTSAPATFTYQTAVGATGSKILTATATGGLTTSHTATYSVLNAIGVLSANFFLSPYNWIVQGTGTSAYALSVNPGSYFKTAVTVVSGDPGTLVLNLDSSIWTGLTDAGVALAAGDYPIIRSVIDGVATDVQTVASTNAYTLATGLAVGTHALQVNFKAVKLASTTINRWNTPLTSVYGIKVLNLSIDANAVSVAPTLRSKRMIVFGDSITEGADCVGSGNSTLSQDATQVWGQLLAIGMDAEVGIIGWSYSGWNATGAGNVPQFYNSATPSWSNVALGQPRSWTVIPDYVVCNHGQNDSASISNYAYNPGTNTGWIKDVRAAVGSTAWIFLIQPYTGARAGEMAIAVNAWVAANPSDTSVAAISLNRTFNSGETTNDNLHPNVRGHAIIGAKDTGILKDTIQPTLPQIAAAIWTRSQRTITG